MASQELGVGLGIGLTLLVVLGIILWHACKKQFAPTLQADPESGQGRLGVGGSGGHSSSPNHISRMQSRHPQPSASIPVYIIERRHTLLGSRQPLIEINVAQPSRSHEPPHIPSRQVQPAPSSSRRTRRRRRTHPLADLSGQELRAMDRGRLNSLPLPQKTNIATKNPNSSRTEPTVELVEDGLFGSFATEYVQEPRDLTSANEPPISTASIDSNSDPRVSPITPPTPEPAPSRSTRRNSTSSYEISVTTVSQTGEARIGQWRFRQSMDSIPNDIDDVLSRWHELPANLQQSNSSSDPPPPPRRQRRATDSSNRRRSHICHQPRRQRSVTFDNGRNRTFVLPPAAVVSAASTTAGPSNRLQDVRPTSPMPGSWPLSPTMSPPVSENGMRLRNITVRNTAANGAQKFASKNCTSI